MMLLRTVLLAAALALPITAMSVAMTDTPVAAAEKMKAKAKKVAKAKKPAKKAAGYKHCGTYMYKKGGKCMDARSKKG